MMDKAEHELPEKAVVVIWDWISVQVPPDKISLFIDKIRSTIVENLEEYQLRECAFLVYCDARFIPVAITRELAKSSNVDIHHIESHESSWNICKKLYRFHVDYDPGIVVLISDASTAYGPILTKLSRCGWRIQLFHPENASRDYLDYGDQNWPIEQLLDGETGNINIGINFSHTVYFLVSELWNSDESLGFLSNVTEQYESNVIYFNQKVAEAIIELKAFEIESAISLLEARIRACLPNNGLLVASTTDACRLEILPNANFLSDIKIKKLVKASNEKERNIPYPNASTDIATLEATIGNNSLNAITSSSLNIPYPMMPTLSFMQQLAFPFQFNINSAATITHSDSSAVAAAAVYNIAAAAAAAANVATHTALLQHVTPTVTFNPCIATQMATAASQILQEQQNEFQQQVMQQLQDNNCNMADTINEYHHNEDEKEEDDSKSHKEVKIEVFSEDENDYGDEEDDISGINQTGNRNGWELECDKSLDENTNVMIDHQSYGGAATYDITEYVNEYPALPTIESGNALCYSAVVKGIKPLKNNNKPSFNLMKECANVAVTERNITNKSTISTQISQWDQMIVERGSKFNKPAPQCIHWNNPKHRLDFPCRFWHPREQCRYYPNCSNTADECGFAHPFCGDFCRCPKGKRDPQKNHRIPEERYYGSGDRMKYSHSNGTQ